MDLNEKVRKYVEEGKYEDALTFLNRKLKKEDKYNVTRHIIDIYLIQGEYEKAEEHAENIREIALKENKAKSDILQSLPQVKELMQQGQYKETAKRLREVKNLLEKNQNVQIGVYNSLLHLAIVMYHVEKYEIALNYLYLCNENILLFERDTDKAEVYLYIILCGVELEENHSDIYLEKLRSIYVSSDDEEIQSKYDYASAVYVLKHPTLQSLAKTQQCLERAVKRRHLPTLLETQLLYQLCETYLIEIKMFKSQEAIDNAKSITGKLFDKSQAMGSDVLSIEALVLNAKLNFLSMDGDKAIELLQSAENLSQKKKLLSLTNIVQKIQKQLLDELNYQERFVSYNQPLFNMMKENDFYRFLSIALS